MVYTPVSEPLAVVAVGRDTAGQVAHRAWCVVVDIETEPANASGISAALASMTSLNIRTVLKELAEDGARATPELQVATAKALLKRITESLAPVLDSLPDNPLWSVALSESATGPASAAHDVYVRPTKELHLYEALAMAASKAARALERTPLQAADVALFPSWASGARLKLKPEGDFVCELAMATEGPGSEAALPSLLRLLHGKFPSDAGINGQIAGAGLLAAGLSASVVDAFTVATAIVRPASPGVDGLYDLPRYGLAKDSSLAELLDRAADRLMSSGVGEELSYDKSVQVMAKLVVKRVHSASAIYCMDTTINPFKAAKNPLDVFAPVSPDEMLRYDGLLARYDQELAQLTASRLPALAPIEAAVHKQRVTSQLLVNTAKDYDGTNLGRTLLLLKWIAEGTPPFPLLVNVLPALKAEWVRDIDRLSNPGRGDVVFKDFDTDAWASELTAKGEGAFKVTAKVLNTNTLANDKLTSEKLVVKDKLDAKSKFSKVDTKLGKGGF